ncbi:cytochrome P450 [Streptomyces rubradiris]|uniref:Cytochrome P450 n=1 Tax=Streptomyces rubradiris TaxID=285531 RepID=A0ABQ3RIA4_STRRR|nr:cytochrome P450 [Streptomyces rubradiris]GHH21569.1 cytochrome P450 [Streptomyces rubradiris]GHI55593.1 cytochrome P450 [Streptomyces rubradiris]
MLSKPVSPLPAEPPRGCPFSPPPQYAVLRVEEPVSRVSLPDGSWAWLITRYEDVRAVLSDPRFSSDSAAPGFPRSGMVTAGEAGSLIRTDPPEHTRRRRMLTPHVTVKSVSALRPRIQEITDELCDAMEAEREAAGSPGYVDLVRSLALPLPSSVISLLLGVPDEDHDVFQSITATVMSRVNAEEERTAARARLLTYLRELVAGKERNPGDDILSGLIHDRMGAGELTHDEVVGTAALLLVAGHETTANMIGLGALTLLRYPHAAEELRKDPSLMPGAVEELLRFHSVTRSGPRRAATADVEVGGQVIKAGEGIICALASANRDPEVFPDPDGFDPRRANSQRHVAFGYGVHQCLGQALARAELQISLNTLLRRFPELRLAVEFEDVPFRSDMLVYGCHALPVTW